MIAFITLIYTAFVVVVFIIFKVKPRPYPVALTAAAGVLMIGTVVVLWVPSAPISSQAIVSRYVVQLVPWVKGQVTSIPAQPNVPLKKGDVLYNIDSTPYQLSLDLASSQLKAGESNVLQLEAAVKVAQAGIEKANADIAQAKASLDVALSIDKLNPAAIAKLKLEEARNQYSASEAGLAAAEAGLTQAQIAVTAANDSVNGLRSQVEIAKFNLQQCTVKAPADGFITNWQIRPGTFVTPIPLAAAGTFIDTSQTGIVASYPANQLMYVKPGQQVEMVFKSRPGYLFRGTVDTIIDATGEGQFETGGKLPSAASIGSAGFLAVRFNMENPSDADTLPMGTPGAVAIYTDHGKPFAMISKVTIRLKKWLYFLPIP